MLIASEIVSAPSAVVSPRMNGTLACAATVIEYLEEPLRDPRPLLTSGGASSFPVPIALDESLVTCDPRELASLRGIHALILKPTLLGYERSRRFAEVAAAAGSTAVVTSTFESSLGSRRHDPLDVRLGGRAQGRASYVRESLLQRGGGEPEHAAGAR